MWANLQRIRELLNQKLGIKLSKIWFGIRDLEKNLFRIPHSGVKKASDYGSLIRNPNTGCAVVLSFYHKLKHVPITTAVETLFVISVRAGA